MRVILLLGAILLVSIARPEVGLAQTCVEECETIWNPGGTIKGFGCVTGTQGWDCVATVGTCSIATTGCNEMEEEATEAGAGTEVQEDPAFLYGYAFTESGLGRFMLVPCERSGALPIVMAGDAIRDVSHSLEAEDISRDPVNSPLVRAVR